MMKRHRERQARAGHAEQIRFCSLVVSRLDPLLLGRGFYPPQCIRGRDEDGPTYSVLYESYGDALRIYWPSFSERTGVEPGDPFGHGLELWVEYWPTTGIASFRFCGWSASELCMLYGFEPISIASGDLETMVDEFATILGGMRREEPQGFPSASAE